MCNYSVMGMKLCIPTLFCNISESTVKIASWALFFKCGSTNSGYQAQINLSIHIQLIWLFEGSLRIDLLILDEVVFNNEGRMRRVETMISIHLIAVK